MGRFRRSIVGATVSIAIATVVGATIVGAIVGAQVGGAMDARLGARGLGVGLGAFLGAIAGFLPTALAAAIALGVAETAANTRRVARALARIAAPEPDGYDDEATEPRPSHQESSGVARRLSVEAAFLAFVGGAIWIGVHARARGLGIFDLTWFQNPNPRLALAAFVLGLLAAGTAPRWPAFAGTLMLAGAAVVIYGSGGAAPIHIVAIGASLLGAVLAFVAAYRGRESEGL